MNATAWPDLAGAQRNGCPSGSRNLRLLRLLWLHELLLLIGLELGLRWGSKVHNLSQPYFFLIAFSSFRFLRNLYSPRLLCWIYSLSILFPFSNSSALASPAFHSIYYLFFLEIKFINVSFLVHNFCLETKKEWKKWNFLYSLCRLINLKYFIYHLLWMRRGPRDTHSFLSLNRLPISFCSPFTFHPSSSCSL